jgi:hypothetical protein
VVRGTILTTCVPVSVVQLQQSDENWRHAASDAARWKEVADEERRRAATAELKAREALAVEHQRQLHEIALQRDAQAAMKRTGDAEVRRLHGEVEEERLKAAR